MLVTILLRPVCGGRHNVEQRALVRVREDRAWQCRSGALCTCGERRAVHSETSARARGSRAGRCGTGKLALRFAWLHLISFSSAFSCPLWSGSPQCAQVGYSCARAPAQRALARGRSAAPLDRPRKSFRVARPALWKSRPAHRARPWGRESSAVCGFRAKPTSLVNQPISSLLNTS